MNKADDKFNFNFPGKAEYFEITTGPSSNLRFYERVHVNISSISVNCSNEPKSNIYSCWIISQERVVLRTTTASADSNDQRFDNLSKRWFLTLDAFLDLNESLRASRKVIEGVMITR